MMSLTESNNAASTTCCAAVALYRGLKVAVYEVDKTELALARNDLVELVNVSGNCSLLACSLHEIANSPITNAMFITVCNSTALTHSLTAAPDQRGP